jgi:3-oxoacyl-[acyl-carrier-protein] synthase III
MALFSIPNFRISGISCCVPKNVEYNKDYKWISDKERNLLIKKTGIEERRIAGKGVTTADLCMVAAEKLIEGLHWQKDEIQLLVFISQSRDYVLPATACILQDKMGLPQSCIAFDVSMGCSAFPYGLSIVGNYLAHCGIKKALLLMGDVSPLASYRDKTTYPLFGQAGSATALEYDENAVPMHFNLQTDGAGHKAIMIPSGGMRNFPTRKMFDIKKIDKGVYRNNMQLVLDGYAVFDFSLREVVPNINALLDYAKETLNDYDYVVFHQANLLINDTLRKKLKLPPEKVPSSLKKFGNTSSASIPLTVVTEMQHIVANQKLNMLFCGFGVGLSWGSVISQTENIFCPDLIEI